ncbi:SDR family NAD(P)-dependent oxidoreductase [Actinocrinis sp.]|uniref:SDR family NAD(P)-dependent oxidoreductase n=1 Tax=Actinocrinis sp. TaxID=1920516 RepID=UPI002C7BD7A7|nr:SDR family NAD(P)-dependent oxidoreductase [Actinocrinis sp.]HXR70589.1 SDR family NAD(P)-dependent oxidoreductase [Actinocrinis sp.]
MDAGSKQLSVFVVEYALARAMERRGVTAHLVLGTGVGALVAGVLTGERNLEDALRSAAESTGGAQDGVATSVVTSVATSVAVAADWSHEADRIAANAQVCIELGSGGDGARTLISGSDGAHGPVVFNALPEAGESEAARLLATLGRLWELGVELDWDAVRGCRGRIVQLPAYPFQRQRFWPEPAAKSTAQRQEQQESGDSAAQRVELLERRWTEPESAMQGASTLSGRFVLLADARGIADALAQRLRGEGVEVIVARSAEELDGEALPDADGTLTIVDLMSVEERDELGAVLAASRSLARWGSLGAQSVQVLLVTRGGHEVLGGERANPAQAAVAVLPVVAAQEYLSLDVRGIDLDSACSIADAADALLNELRAPAADLLVAYRAGTRYASGYATASADDAGDSRDARVVLRGETYLITGGLGDIGLTLAEHLIRRGAGAVVLSSRGGLPDDPSDPRRAAVNRLRELGAQVHVPRADVTDSAAMRALFAEFRIDGVIHAAAQTAPESFRSLADLDERSVASHLHAKVGGAKVLARVFAELPEVQAPRWCHVFSSTSALLGGVTFGGYAAANAALAAVASQAQGGQVRWISAAWDTWTCTLSRIAGGAIGASLVAHSMSDEEALAAFDRSIACGRASVVIAAGGLADRLPRARVAAPAGTAAMETVAALVAPGMRFARPELPQPYTPPITDTERELAEVWAGVLGVEPVGTRDNFFDLGGNSLLVPQMLGLLKQRFGVSLPTVTVFEAPSVRALGAIIDGQGGASAQVSEVSEVCPGERDNSQQSEARVPMGRVPEDCPAERDNSLAPVNQVSEVCPAERDTFAGTAPDWQSDRRIAIVGMSGRFPGAGDVGEFWRNLCEGVESITFFSPEELIEAGVEPETLRDPAYVPARAVLDDIAGFDAGFFGISPRMAALTDPQQRLFLEVCWEALEQAGYCRPEHRGRVGVYGGTHISTYLLGIRDRLGDDVSQFEIAMGNEKDALATTVSYLFDLHGPSVAVQTFCSTSLVATHLAVRALRDGDCEMALAGGVSIRVPDKRGHRYEEGGMESPDGHVRTFDAKARGAMFGDGAAVVLLKRLSDALRDGDHVWGVIRGCAMNNDGGLKVGYTAPSLVGQAKVVAEAMADAGVRAEQVGYVEAHGSGTRLGDPIEVAALTRAFGPTPTNQYCPIGSVKTNVGHLDRAAGAAGLIKATLAAREGLIPPTLHFTTPNPEIDFANSPFYVNNRLQTWAAPAGEPRIAGLNSLGMGGTNVHVVVEEPPRRPTYRPEDPATSRRFQVLPVSARSEAAADDSCQRLGDHLAAHPDTRLADVAYTLQVGRKTFEHRRAVVASQLGGAVNVLTRVDGAAPASRVEATQERPVAFLLAGVGEQYPGMVGELYRREPAFRARLDDCLSRIASSLRAEGADVPDVAGLTDLLAGPRGGGASLAALLGRATESDPRAEALQRTEIVQPLMFAVDYALAATLMDWGLRPAAMLGYSLGEYVAACLAGVLSLGDAIALVVHRATLISGVERGAMAAVSLSAEELRTRFRIRERGLDIAAVNGPQTVVVAGPSAVMDALLAELRQGEIACRPLQTTHAFHSRMLAQVAAPLTDWIAANISLNPPKLPYLSNVTGHQADPALVRDPAYWARHMCETVQFAAGADALLADPELALVEIGPGPSLGALLRAAGCPPQRWPLITTTLPAGTDPRPADETLADCLARLWLIGAEIDWTAYHGRRDGSAEVYAVAAPGRIPLPTYPFQRQKYWIEADKPAVRGAATSALPAEGTGTLSDVGRIPRLPEEQWLHLPVWRQLPATPAAERQSGSWLVFAREGTADRVLAELRRAAAWSGADVTVVRPATAYAAGPAGYTLRPGSTDDALNLLRDLRAGAGWPERVVHLWTLDEPTAAETAAIAAAGEDDDGASGYRDEPGHDYEDAATVALGLHTLVSLARAAGELGMEGWALDIVTSGAHDVLGGGEVRPAAATLVGPALVIPLEYPTVSTRLIDAEQRTDPAAIVAELRRTRTERTIALRGARRWACDYQSVIAPDLPAANDPAANDTASNGTAQVPSTSLREGGVYLITGGLGGIGLAMAERLARSCRAKLVLFGRSGLPPRAHWEAIASGAEAVDESSRGRVARALEIVALGGEVEIVVGDITDPQDARRAVEQAQARFGALHGVLHAAGVPGIGLIQFKRPEDGELVLAPKVAGTRALARALRLGESDEIPLDFLALFSSVTSATGGGPGQVDYCAANAFLAAFAAAWATPDRRVLSVDWGEWVWNGWDEGLGGFDDGLRAFFREHRAAFGISFDEGWRTLLRALGSGEPRLFASTQDLSAMVRLSAGFTVDAALAPTGGHTLDRHPRPDLVTPYQEPSGDTEETIAALWAESLKLDRIGALDNFFELGGNSLLGINLLAALRRAFTDAELPPHILHQAPTVAALAEIVDAGTEGTAEPAPRDDDAQAQAELRRSALKAAAARRRRR